MTRRFFNTGERFLGYPALIGLGRTIATPISLDPVRYEGGMLYADDGQVYYSDGERWRIPVETVDIARPRALTPTTSEEAMKLRLTKFFSPRGLSQTGIYFEVAATEDGFDNPIFTRTVDSETASEYVTVYPGDGLTVGQEFWWRAVYNGTEGSQSEFSLPFQQTYPDLIDTPLPVTLEGATTGAVELTPFTSAFNLSYVETQIELWDLSDDPETDPPVETVTSVAGNTVTLPDSLTDGQGYLWRGRYGGRVGSVGALTYSEWSQVRTILNGAASMLLQFDPAQAVSRTIYLPLGVYGGVVDVTVDWGDTNTEVVQTGGVVSHTYAAGVTGQVTVTISGQLQQYGGDVNQQGLIRVDNIGFKLGLTSLREAFRNVTTNTTFMNPALPPQVTNARGMFRSGNPGFAVDAINTFYITDMSEMFMNAVDFNSSLAALDTSSVTTMERMFYVTAGDMTFNQPIDAWDVSSVQSFAGMFKAEGGATSVFNQSLAEWDISAATNLSSMFEGAVLFNQDLRLWDVSGVSDFSRMFRAADAFNQPLTGWNVSAATDVSSMFEGSAFNNDLSGWVLPSSLKGLFRSAAAFNHPSVVTWDTSGVLDMSEMFYGADAFNQPIGIWDVSAVTTMASMFRGGNSAHIFNQPLSAWDVSSVLDMSFMFAKDNVTTNSRENAFNQPIGDWSVSNVVNMTSMFAYLGTANWSSLIPFNQDISAWVLNPSGVALSGFMDGPAAGTHDFSTGNYSRLLAGWASTIQGNAAPSNIAAAFTYRTYNATDYFPGAAFEDAVEGRAFFTRSRRLIVAGASTADANGDFLWNGATQQYEKANGWYFVNAGTAWELRDDLDAVQATALDATMPAEPYNVGIWDGVLSGASVDINGMGWTITDGGLV